jgi:glycosyltransferase domain-containing protein
VSSKNDSRPLPADEQLTILLTLRGPYAYTLRWLAYANHVRLPFTVCIADGSGDDRVAALLTAGTPLSHVRYEYVRYQPDGCDAHFHATVADALTNIRTPFVALGDNDDFFLVAGLRQALAFLLDHPDYAACGGQMATFWAAPGGGSTHEEYVYGDVEWKCHSHACALNDDTARDRLRGLARCPGYPLYHHVHRTRSLAEQFALLRDLDFADLFLHEQLFAFLTTIAGKIGQLDTLYMARQRHTPESSTGARSVAHGDRLSRMFAPPWSRDFSRFLEATAAALAGRDGLSLSEARRYIVEAYRMAVAPALVADVMKEPTATLRGTAALGVTRRLLALPSDHPLRRFTRAVYRRVPWISPDVLQGTELRGTPIAGAADEMGRIHEFLTRDA